MAQSQAELLAQIAKLKAENAALAAGQRSAARITAKATEKGGISVYGLSRWPVTLYPEQWQRLATEGMPLVKAILDGPESAEILARAAITREAAKAARRSA